MSLIEYDADSGHAVTEPPHDTEAIGPTFELLDITLIVSSPTNPRKHFDQVKLQELADSIQAAGVHQPVLVRPLPASRMEDTFRSRKPGAQLPTHELVAVLPTDVVNEQLQAMELISPREAKAGKAEKKAQDARTLLEKFERTWRRAAVAKLHAVGSTIAIDGLHVEVQRQMALHLVPSLRQDERAIYGELFGIGKVAQADGIRDHVRAAGVEDIDLVCMILLALQDTTNNVDYHGKATETPRLEAIAAQLEVDLQAVRAEAKEALKPKAKAKKPAPAKATKAKGPPIKYRGPNGETWTGRGLQPAWVKALLRSGATLEALEVPAPAAEQPDDAALAVGTAVRFKEGLKGSGGKVRKCSGRVGTIEKCIQAGVYSVRFGKKPGDAAVGAIAELEVVTTTEDAQAGIAKALQELEPVDAWPFPPRTADKKAAKA